MDETTWRQSFMFWTRLVVFFVCEGVCIYLGKKPYSNRLGCEHKFYKKKKIIY